MDYIDILQGVLSHIDENIGGELSAEALAMVAGFSTYHFCRVFQWNVGYPVMEYVRRRRLAFAASELSSGRRILDIALDCGFETHSGFSKAFRRHFGCTPENYRMHAHFDRPSLPVLARHKNFLGGMVMEPKWVTLPVVRLAGYTMKTTNVDGENNRAIPTFWTKYLTDGRMQALHSQPFVGRHAEYGACFPEDPEAGCFEYMIGVEVQDGAEVPEGFDVREIPAATYAVFSTPPADKATFTAAIQGVWQYMYAEWFPNSGYEYMPGGVDFEFYDERCMGETGNVCDIYLPVVPKG